MRPDHHLKPKKPTPCTKPHPEQQQHHHNTRHQSSNHSLIPPHNTLTTTAHGSNNTHYLHIGLKPDGRTTRFGAVNDIAARWPSVPVTAWFPAGCIPPNPLDWWGRYLWAFWELAGLMRRDVERGWAFMRRVGGTLGSGDAFEASKLCRVEDGRMEGMEMRPPAALEEEEQGGGGDDGDAMEVDEWKGLVAPTLEEIPDDLLRGGPFGLTRVANRTWRVWPHGGRELVVEEVEGSRYGRSLTEPLRRA